MASYFDEHDCEPLGEGQTPDQTLHLARLLLDTGLAVEWDMEFGRVFGREKKVPASKKFIEDLPTSLIPPSEAALEKKCPVCIGLFDEEDEVKTLPCAHKFHTTCITPWLQKVNTCPLCRQEFPTDDPDYESYRKHKVNTCPLCRQEFPTDDPDYESYRKHKVNTCPLCRQEFPTDDPDYESYRKHKVNTCPLCRQEFPTDYPDYESYRKHKVNTCPLCRQEFPTDYPDYESYRKHKVNTCPLCRQEFPTDDPDYESYRKHKARAKQREYELDTLHNSMFG